jgi:hypothetical protein
MKEFLYDLNRLIIYMDNVILTLAIYIWIMLNIWIKSEI